MQCNRGENIVAHVMITCIGFYCRSSASVMLVSVQSRFLQIALPKVMDSFGKWFEKHPTDMPALLLTPCDCLCLALDRAF